MFENLKKLRLSLNLTQEEFAKPIGLPKTTYYGYESGKHEPSSKFWIAVAKKYGVTIDYLMGFSDIPSPVKEADREAAAQKRLVELTGNFDQMNEAGQERLVEHSNLLLHDGTLLKNFQPDSVEKEA